METQISCSKRRPVTAMLAYYLILLSFVICTCQANSSANVDGQSLIKSTGKDVVDDGGKDDAVIESIVSQLSSWMKQKRKSAKRNQDFDEDIMLQQPPQTLDRPFVTLAYAQTLDGMIAAKVGTNGATTTSNLRLSCPQSMILTHRLRNMHDAILIGGSTFLLDAPRLNVRLPIDFTSHEIDHPMPIVLDTHLNHLQTLLFDEIVSTALSSQSSSPKEEILPDITIDKIRAHHPIICCSSDGAHSFLDILEVFQEQQITKRKRKKSYKITVYKKIDENDPDEDIYVPIKITIHITHHKKHEDDVMQDVIFTLLPCQIHETTKSLDLQHVLHQLYNQFAIESVMVEGGAGILSSFMNACGDDSPDSRNQRSRGKVVDCICITIAPTIIGGKWGLPALGGIGEEEFGGMMAMKEGEYVSLGHDCIFLGRL
ncbi:hypothetical protein ACHAXR_007840 [Thalassiosira sp. AJA248-18]